MSKNVQNRNNACEENHDNAACSSFVVDLRKLHSCTEKRITNTVRYRDSLHTLWFFFDDTKHQLPFFRMGQDRVGIVYNIELSTSCCSLIFIEVFLLFIINLRYI